MKVKKRTKLHMFIPQTKSVKNTAKLYSLFKNKVMEKSRHKWVQGGKNPVALILNINHEIMDTQEGVIVRCGSFDLLRTDKRPYREIGFTAVVYSRAFDVERRLFVRKNGKAYLEDILPEEEVDWFEPMVQA